MKNSIKVSCLNPRVVINPAYRKYPVIYQKNPDFYLKVPCGRCRLCRRKLAKEWQFRLHKEFESTSTHFHNSTEQPRVAFLTFTFSDDFYTDDDSLFAPWLVRFRDNFRKAFGKSPRYFAVTDRGAKEGRLHLHMLLFNPYDSKRDCKVSLNKLHDKHFWWPYGFVDCQWVRKGIASANYVIGYITGANIEKEGKKHGITLCEKAQKHKPKVYVSKGLGRGFDICTNYLDAKKRGILTELNGYVYALPRYYRYKWFSRQERYLQNVNHRNEYYEYLNTFGINVEFVNTYFGCFDLFENGLFNGIYDHSLIRFELNKTTNSQKQMMYAVQQLRRFDTPEKVKQKQTFDIINENLDFEFRPWENKWFPFGNLNEDDLTPF